MHAADLGVEVDEAGGQARQAAVAAVGLCGHGQGALDGVAERHEALGHAAGLGQLVELLFGGLDLLLGVELGVARLGLGGDLAADADQVPAQGQVVDGAGVVGGVGRRRGAVDQVGQIADAAQFLERGVAGELFGDEDRLGELTLADIGLDGLEQALVERLEEVAGLEVVAEALEGGVVEQQGAEQGLFGLDIGRRAGDGGRLGRVLGGGAQV